MEDSAIPETRKGPKDYEPLFTQMINLLQSLQRVPTLPERRQLISIGPSAYTFDSMGYKYFALYASASVTITAVSNGFAYTIDLIPGYNGITIPPDTSLSFTTQQTFLAEWSNILK